MSRIISILESVFMAVSVFCMLAIMLVVSVDALGRYAFNSPLPWSYELVTYFLMVAIIYFAGSSTFQQGDHVGVDLFYHIMGPRTRALATVFCTLSAVAVFVLVTWSGWKEVVTYYTERDFIPGYILWPTWMSYLPIPLGTMLMVVRMLHHAATLLRQGHDPNVVEHLDGVSAEGGE